MPSTQLEADLDLVMHRRQVVADGVLTVELRDPDGAPLPAWEPGAHIDLHLGPDLVRQYSLCGESTDRSHWRVAVLLERGGRGGSRFVHDELADGSLVHVRGPRNHFPLRPAKRYLFIAGGIGITPLIPMMSAATAAGAEWQLSYGGRTLDSMAFVPDLSATYGPRVSVHPQDSHGLLDLEALLGEPQPETFVYCCGPGPLLDAVESLCTSWPGGTLHVERFTPKMVDKPAIDLPFEVEIVSSGQIFTVPTDQTLLEVLRDNGVVVESSCEEGTCGSCETAVVDGAIDHRDSVLTDEERGEGKLMMVCVSRAACPRIVLDL